MQDFRTIIREYHPIFFKISRSYTDQEADFEDLYQEMLVQVWRSLPRFEGNAKLSTFLYRVALNTAMDFQKKSSRQKKRFEAPGDLPHLPVEDGFEVAETQQEKLGLLYRCIRSLKKEDRSLILLYLEEKSYEEISEIVGISKSNVGVKLMRIKRKLHQRLTEQGYERI
jgi:RNA polymerase sigma-70 factor (ECF subfamily)